MMTHNINGSDPIFVARLTPHRSLNARGFKVLMGVIGALCLIIGAGFYFVGALPIVGFMGLDFLIIYLAFRMNYKSARAYEDVEISRERVLLKKVSSGGRVERFSFPQFGTRFEVDRHKEIGITQMRLANRNRHAELGYLLNPIDRESFAIAFQSAMVEAKK